MFSRKILMKFFWIFVTLAAMHFHGVVASEQSIHTFYEIAKEKCHDIGAIRVEMDRINNQILELLAERTAYVKRAGDLKSRTTRIADDRQRVADQEQKIVARSIELGLPVEISIPAFRAIMETSIQFQQNYIDQYK